jgi:hypothetical protein
MQIDSSQIFEVQFHEPDLPFWKGVLAVFVRPFYFGSSFSSFLP